MRSRAATIRDECHATHAMTRRDLLRGCDGHLGSRASSSVLRAESEADWVSAFVISTRPADRFIASAGTNSPLDRRISLSVSFAISRGASAAITGKPRAGQPRTAEAEEAHEIANDRLPRLRRLNHAMALHASVRAMATGISAAER